MSDRSTPETDDIARGNHVVPVEWAQQLERERDEAREAIVGWENKWKCAVDMAARAELERDEARRKLNNLDVTAIHSCHNECQRPICVLRRERDEAREALMRIEDLFIDCTDVIACRENMGMIAIAALQGIK